MPPGKGLSPRVRRHRSPECPSPPRGGSIAACAASPGAVSSSIGMSRVYRRVCGVTLWELRDRYDIEGLSPRVRRHQPWEMNRVRPIRSIAACAASPRPRPTRSMGREVYRRVCGVTPAVSIGLASAPGLSPRVRRHQPAHLVLLAFVGSIAACAASPPSAAAPRPRPKVYRRVCGVTYRYALPKGMEMGLSPRVRRHPSEWEGRGRLRGSIAACAASPPVARPDRLPDEVYRRVCGVTCLPVSLRTASGWSIAACAASPASGFGHDRQSGVYRRVCGVTSLNLKPFITTKGLSPRVRRHPGLIHRGGCVSGSIAACAASPDRCLLAAHSWQVYRRVCGVTPALLCRTRGHHPLSMTGRQEKCKLCLRYIRPRLTAASSARARAYCRECPRCVPEPFRRSGRPRRGPACFPRPGAAWRRR